MTKIAKDLGCATIPTRKENKMPIFVNEHKPLFVCDQCGQAFSTEDAISVGEERWCFSCVLKEAPNHFDEESKEQYKQLARDLLWV